jgi:Ribbon-helix-helix protein, copG family
MPAKRVLISIDERTLERIDEAAQRNGLTRSRFLAEAAMAQIEGPGGGPTPQARESLRALDDLARDRR